MKTKEEIIDRAVAALDSWRSERDIVESAMDEWAGYLISQKESITTTYEIPKHILDEYAKRKVIDFNKWQTEQGYVNGFDDTWIKALNGSPVASSTEELYNQFTQQI